MTEIKMNPEVLSLRWNNHGTTFFHVLEDIRKKELYTDITLACDGKYFPVHKFVLSTCSDYFQEILERTQCKHPIIVLKDIRPKDLESLLNYMYIGEVKVSQNELPSLIKAAECLRVKGLAIPDELPVTLTSKKPQKRLNILEKDDNQIITPNKRNKKSNIFISTSSVPEDSAIVDKAASQDLIPSLNEIQEDIVKDLVKASIKEEVQEHETKDTNSENVEEEEANCTENASDDPADASTGLNNDSNNQLPIPSTSSFEEQWSSGDVENFDEDDDGDITLDHFENSQFGDQTLANSQMSQNPLTGSGVGGFANGFFMIKDGNQWRCGYPGCKPYITTRKDNLRTHVMTHTGNKPFKCQFCHYCTTTSKYLKIHTRRHTGEKPFSCLYCDYNTIDSSTLKKHVARYHLELVGFGNK